MVDFSQLINEEFIWFVLKLITELYEGLTAGITTPSLNNIIWIRCHSYGCPRAINIVYVVGCWMQRSDLSSFVVWAYLKIVLELNCSWTSKKHEELKTNIWWSLPFNSLTLHLLWRSSSTENAQKEWWWTYFENIQVYHLVQSRFSFRHAHYEVVTNCILSLTRSDCWGPCHNRSTTQVRVIAVVVNLNLKLAVH